MAQTIPHNVFMIAIIQISAIFEMLDETIVKRCAGVMSGLMDTEQHVINQISEMRIRILKPQHTLESTAIVQLNEAKSIIKAVQSQKRLTAGAIPIVSSPSIYSFLSEAHTGVWDLHSSSSQTRKISARLGLVFYPDRPLSARGPTTWVRSLPHTSWSFDSIESPNRRHDISKSIHSQLPNSLTSPTGIALHPVTGDIYIVNQLVHCVHVLDHELNYRFSFGESGSADGFFRFPSRISISPSGVVAVVEPRNNRVQLFESCGQHKMTIRGGKGENEFKGPCNVAFDSMDNIYITDSTTKRIHKFNSDGTYLMYFGHPSSGAEVGSSSNLYIDENDRIITIGAERNYILVYDVDGKNTQKFDILESPNTKMTRCITPGPQSSIVIRSFENGITLFYDVNGCFRKQICISIGLAMVFLPNGKFLALQSGGGAVYF